MGLAAVSGALSFGLALQRIQAQRLMRCGAVTSPHSLSFASRRIYERTEGFQSLLADVVLDPLGIHICCLSV